MRASVGRANAPVLNDFDMPRAYTCAVDRQDPPAALPVESPIGPAVTPIVAPTSRSPLEPPGAPPEGPSPHTRAELLAPRSALASCVRAYVVRDTRGAALAPPQRLNHFPASPLAAITWFLAGQALVVHRGDAAVHEPVSRVVVSGPHTAPVVSLNPGPVHALIMLVHPQALALLTGVDVSTLVDRFCALDDLLGPDWQAMARRVLGAPDEAAALRVLEDFLEPRWRPLAAAAVPRIERYRHWVEGVALRAAQSAAGRSLRQVERRIKQWAGLPLRDLRRMARSEQAFLMIRAASERGTLDWAEAAAEAGFSDQAHLCRDSRRMTGASPGELRRLVESDEAYWSYRLWQ